MALCRERGVDLLARGDGAAIDLSHDFRFLGEARIDVSTDRSGDHLGRRQGLGERTVGELPLKRLRVVDLREKRCRRQLGLSFAITRIGHAADRAARDLFGVAYRCRVADQI